MDWWVTNGTRPPLGPVSTELLLKGIGAGKIPGDTLVCEVGGTTWKSIKQVPPFSVAIVARQTRPRFDSTSEVTIADVAAQHDFWDECERTTVDQSPLRRSEPPPQPRLQRFDDSDEKTIVDESPLRPSEPPR